MQVFVTTEVWNTSKGKVAKAVVRNTDGTFVGATNQTKPVPAKAVRPRVTIKGR
jgi:hypothetical protein